MSSHQSTSGTRVIHRRLAKVVSQGVLYPWFIALYPVLFLYLRNQPQLYSAEVVLHIMVIVGSVTLLFGVLQVMIRSASYAGVLITFLVFYLFGYGHLFNLTGLTDRAHVWTLPLWSGLFIGFAISLWTVRREVGLLTPGLNIASAVLLLLPAWNVAYNWATQTYLPVKLDDPLIVPLEIDIPLTPPAEPPDIYYIILDGYSSSAFLMEHHNIDNREFTQALTERGFYIAEESRSNYGLTLPSVASSLNMQYLGFTANQDDAYATVVDNIAAEKLQAAGYEYIHIMSGFFPTSHTANVNIDFTSAGPTIRTDMTGNRGKSSFFPFLVETTILRPFVGAWVYQVKQPHQYYDWRAPERTLMAWDALARTAANPEPTFTFVHLLKPHEPYVFDENGQINRTPQQTPEEVEIAFEAQLRFVNQQMLLVIDRLLSDSDTPPIIIVQGDHGLSFGNYLDPLYPSQPHEILNAYLLPDTSILYPTISPVNSFRAVFNTVFDTNYPLLEDRMYASPQWYDAPFDFIDVTERYTN